MPELPDIESYVEALRERIIGQPLERLAVYHPFLLRTATPAPADLAGKKVQAVRRMGKRLVFSFEEDLWAVLHLMIAGRLQWRPAVRAGPAAAAPASAPPPRAARPKASPKGLLAAWQFPAGRLTLTEAGTKRRAALHLLRGAGGLADLDPGGLEVFAASREEFTRRLRLENHTVKRALADPRLFAGIGNAYSDEILHAARLSPFRPAERLTPAEVERLYAAARRVLAEWVERLRAERAGGFPGKVTAFHPGMAVHGRYGKPCPACGTAVQRIRYAENECNYCPVCQAGGTVYADRALSRLLKGDWPRTVEELERLSARRQEGRQRRLRQEGPP
jgi:formamidopyrimidine-DNA glycosylase